MILLAVFGVRGEAIRVWFSPNKLESMLVGECTADYFKTFSVILDEVSHWDKKNKKVILGVAEVDADYNAVCPLMNPFNKSESLGQRVGCGVVKVGKAWIFVLWDFGKSNCNGQVVLARAGGPS